ncbi:MAG: hypothetical protein ACUZ8N_13950 [Candidatus Scalindua sp.]
MPKVEKHNNLQQNTVPLVSTAKLGYLQGLSYYLDLSGNNLFVLLQFGLKE